MCESHTKREVTKMVKGKAMSVGAVIAHKHNSSLGEKPKRYWLGPMNRTDDFGYPIRNIFIDGKTKQGPWAIMSPQMWKLHGFGLLGTGYGQKYEKQVDGRWLKTEG